MQHKENISDRKLAKIRYSCSHHEETQWESQEPETDNGKTSSG